MATNNPWAREVTPPVQNPWDSPPQAQDNWGEIADGSRTPKTPRPYAPPTTTPQPNNAVNQNLRRQMYSPSDPLGAVLNTLRDMGIMGNPYSQAFNRATKTVASGMLPQFVFNAMGGGYGGDANMEDEFRKFVSGQITNPSQQSYGNIAGSLGDFNALLRQVAQVAAGMPDIDPNMEGTQRPDMSTPEGVAAMNAYLQSQSGQGGGATGGLSPLQMALAGMFLDPASQQNLFLGAYMPFLGPTMTAGLGRAIQPLADQWDSYYDPLLQSDPRTSMMSFLDILTGSTGIPGIPKGMR